MFFFWLSIKYSLESHLFFCFLLQALSTKPMCEEKLASRLEELINEISSLEVKMESNAQKLRWKLFAEWEEFQKK